MRRIGLLLILLPVLFLVACGSSGNTRMRAAHLVVDGGGMDVDIDNNRQFTNLRYLDVSSYRRVDSGDHQIEVDLSGSNVSSDSAHFARDVDHTLVVAGFRGALQRTLLADDNSAPPAGQFKLRFLHESPNAGAADFYALADSADFNTTSAAFVQTRFGTNAGYTTLPAGTYNFRISSAGVKDNVVETGPVSMAAGQIRTAVLVNAPAGSANPFSIIFMADAN